MHEQDVWRVRFTRQHGEAWSQTLEGLITFRYGASGTWAAHAALLHWTWMCGVPGGAENYPMRYLAEAIRMKDGEEIVAGKATAVRDSLDGKFLNENQVDILQFEREGTLIRTRESWTEAVRH